MPFSAWLDNFDTLEMCHLSPNLVHGGKVQLKVILIKHLLQTVPNKTIDTSTKSNLLFTFPCDFCFGEHCNVVTWRDDSCVEIAMWECGEVKTTNTRRILIELRWDIASVKGAVLLLNSYLSEYFAYSRANTSGMLSVSTANGWRGSTLGGVVPHPTKVCKIKCMWK